MSNLTLGMNNLFSVYDQDKEFEQQQQRNINQSEQNPASASSSNPVNNFQTSLTNQEYGFSANSEPFQHSFSPTLDNSSSANSTFGFPDLGFSNDYEQQPFSGSSLEQLQILDTSFHNIQNHSYNSHQQQLFAVASPTWDPTSGNTNYGIGNQMQYNRLFSNSAPSKSTSSQQLLVNDLGSSTGLHQSVLSPSGTSSNAPIEPNRATYSKHISNVMSHFTSSKEGVSKLINEIDDFIHVVSASGAIHFASPSVKRLLEQSQDVIVGMPIFDLLHQADRGTAKKCIEQAISTNSEFTMYIRYISLHGSVKLCEVKGKPYFAIESESSPATQGQTMVILSAREYSSKGMQFLDSIIELQIQTLHLKRRLEEILIQKGQDPSSHFLLSNNQTELSTQEEGNQVDDFTESFLFTIDGQSGKGPLCESSAMDAMDPFTIFQSSNNSAQQSNSSFIGKSVATNTQIPVMAAPPEKKTRKRKTIHTDMFCLQCGTTKSPEWRAGPEGPKTLCNACGLAYYKKNKKLTEVKKKLVSAAAAASNL